MNVLVTLALVTWAPAEPPPAADVARWIRQLNDESFAEREAASRALVAAGPTAAPAVWAATKCANPEVRRRAKVIAAELERRAARALAVSGYPEKTISDGFLRVVAFKSEKPERIHDADLVQLQALPYLENLFLEDTHITNAGLAHVGRIKGLKLLVLTRTSISDEGLAYLTELKQLECLVLDSTQVRGSGLARLRSLKVRAHCSGGSWRGTELA